MSLDASLRQRSRGRLRLGLVAEKVETTSWLGAMGHHPMYDNYEKWRVIQNPLWFPTNHDPQLLAYIDTRAWLNKFLRDQPIEFQRPGQDLPSRPVLRNCSDNGLPLPS